MYFSRILALIFLVTLVLGTSRSVAARPIENFLFLNSGDAITVSGAGTFGVIGGLPVANQVTSYTATDTLSSYAIDTNGTATFTLLDGGTVSNTGPGGFALDDTGSGLVTVSGGLINAGPGAVGLAAFRSGPVQISGGTITAGLRGNGLIANRSGLVTVTGGTISGGEGGYGVESLTESVITITGGSISAAGGTGLASVVGGVINLFSLGNTPFLINGVPMNNTGLGQYQSGLDTISGTLLNGDKLNTTFYNTGTFNLNIGAPPATAPEPSPFAAFAVGLLGLGALAINAKKRHIA